MKWNLFQKTVLKLEKGSLYNIFVHSLHKTLDNMMPHVDPIKIIKIKYFIK